jgi:hypothetical protein
MIEKDEFKRLYGWDDGNIYFMDADHKERCVTEEKELYDRLIQLCSDYFKNKTERRD